MLEVGQAAPFFSLPSTSGKPVALDALRGRKVVLYFYPKDDTPGCTKESCDFRDNLARVRGAGAEIFGVSRDSLGSHAKFQAKYALPFELLSDENNELARSYGAYGTKKLYGKEVEGTIRSTFLIDEQGRIERIWSPVKVDGHVDQVIAAIGVRPRTAAPGGSNGALSKPAGARERGVSAAGRGGAQAKRAGAAGSMEQTTQKSAQKPGLESAKKTQAKAAQEPALKPAKKMSANAAKKTSSKPAKKSGKKVPKRMTTKSIRPARKPAVKAPIGAKAKQLTKKPTRKTAKKPVKRKLAPRA